MPDLDDGYTRIANELLEAILAFPFSKRELKVMLAIIRKTYGFNKKADDMTVTQVADMTGMDRAHASRAISALVAKNAVLKRHGRHGYVLGIQKNHKKWGPCQNGTVPKEHGGRADSAHEPCQKSTEAVPKEHTQKTTPKDNTKDNSKRQRARARGSKRMPSDWMPSRELVEQMLAECPLVDQEAELRKLRDHEFRTAKKDWAATYRNWIRRAPEFRSAPGVAPTTSPGQQTLAAGLRLIAEMEADDEQRENHH